MHKTTAGLHRTRMDSCEFTQPRDFCSTGWMNVGGKSGEWAVCIRSEFCMLWGCVGTYLTFSWEWEVSERHNPGTLDYLPVWGIFNLESWPSETQNRLLFKKWQVASDIVLKTFRGMCRGTIEYSILNFGHLSHSRRAPRSSWIIFYDLYSLSLCA